MIEVECLKIYKTGVHKGEQFREKHIFDNIEAAREWFEHVQEHDEKFRVPIMTVLSETKE